MLSCTALVALVLCLAQTSNASCTTHLGAGVSGGTIKAVSNRRLHQCCAECRSSPTCGAWIWKDTNGGTCWLKTRVDSFYSDDDATAGVVDPPGGIVDNTCKTFPGKKISGRVLKTASRKTLVDCCGICKSTSGCKGYDWRDVDGGTCTFKGSIGGFSSGPGYTAGVTDGTQGPVPTGGGGSVTGGGHNTQCKSHSGQDIAGTELKSVSWTGLGDCCGICQNTHGCKGYAWNDYQGGTCWLKSSVDGLFEKFGVTSGVLEQSTGTGGTGGCKSHPGKDIDGDELHPVSGKRLGECCAVCQNAPGCKGYAWNDYLDGTCWLKSSIRGFFDMPGVTSGVAGGSGPGVITGGPGPRPGPAPVSGKVIKKGVGRHTYYTSYPACCDDPSADQNECQNYNGCTWAGLFACNPGVKKSRSWVKNTDMVAFYDDSDPNGKHFRSRYCGKTIRLTKTQKNGSKKTFTALIQDTCGNSDCNGCCKRSSYKGILVDIEINTAKRHFDSLVVAGFGTLEYEILE